MLSPDLVMRVMPPTVTITATAPAVPKSHAATAVFFAEPVDAVRGASLSLDSVDDC